MVGPLPGIKVYVIHSWTKIWSCAGIRLGSFIAPTIDEYEKVKSFQVPWTVNCVALSFLSAVTKDEVPPPPHVWPATVSDDLRLAAAHKALT